MVPGLYSLWLNIWGSKVSLLTYWSPRVEVTDRYSLDIHSRVIIGWGCSLAGHFMSDKDGDKYLIVAGVIIEREAILGGRSKISPGGHIYPKEVLPTTHKVGPFNDYINGKTIINKF